MSTAQNDYGALLGALLVAADKELTDKQSGELIASFRSLGWDGSRRVVESIRTSANIPRNLFGFTLAALKEEQRYIAKQKYQREYWKVADQDKATTEEFCLTMKCIGLICRFENSSELLIKFGEFLDTSITGNKLLENLKRSEKFYTEQIGGGVKAKKETNNEVF